MENTGKIQRPHTTVILAMSADGKIADKMRSPARFGSKADQVHLEKQVAQADAVLFGAKTLNAYGTTCRVRSPELLEQRQQQGKPPQPVQIVCSASGQISSDLKFFQQPVPHWLLTTSKGSKNLENPQAFEQVLIAEKNAQEIDWIDAFQQFTECGFKRLAILGGGQLVGSLLDANLIDEFWLTVCPIILGGSDAPTPVEGKGFLADIAPKLQLLDVQTVEQEVFLHYRVLQMGS